MAPECVLCHRPIRQRLCFEVEFYLVRSANTRLVDMTRTVEGCVHIYCLKRTLSAACTYTVFVYQIPRDQPCLICGKALLHDSSAVQARVYVHHEPSSESSPTHTLNVYHRECLLRVLELDNPVETMIMAGYV